MKKWILLIICLGLFCCLVGCEGDFPAPPVEDNPPGYRLMFDSYDDILTKYKELLEEEDTSIDLPADDRDRAILAALNDAAAYSYDEPEQKGYGYLDVNGDGVEELILFSEEYFLYSIYTMQKGKPALVYDWLEENFMHRGMIDRAGHIYASSSPDLYGTLETPLTEWYTSVWRLTGEGTLDGITLRTYYDDETAAEPVLTYVGSDGTLSFDIEEQNHIYLWRQWESDQRSGLMSSRRHIGDAGLRFTSVLAPEMPDETLPAVDFSTYDGILSAYRSMVALYPDYNRYDSYQISEQYTAGYRFETDADFALYARLLTAGYDVRPEENRQGQFAQNGQNAYGYAERDLNGDGIKELILLTDAYDIIAVFTMRKDRAELVCLRPDLIDEEGKIYESYASGYYLPDERKVIWSLDEQGNKVMLFEAWSGMVEPNRFAYYRNIDGQTIRIPDEEVEQFMALFDEKVTTTGCAEYMRGVTELLFLSAYARAVPNDSHVLSWTHFENYGDTLKIISVTGKEVSFRWHEQTGETECTIEAVVSSTDRYAFEADGVKGRLAFGVRCVWVLVEESGNDTVSPGAYLYDIFDMGNS